MRAYIVVDLGFGDCGKGLLTDFLARRARAGLVVRYNGGAQAGHNVVLADGRHHTFSQFGSGTFIPGVRTYLSRHVVIHPGALLVEGDMLVQKGVADAFARLRVSDQAIVVTPFHQAANRIRELVRGASRHGSCGVGVGEAVEDGMLHPDERVLAGDLASRGELRGKLRQIQERKRQEIAVLCDHLPYDARLAREYAVFQSDDVIDAWLASLERIKEYDLVAPDNVLAAWLREADSVIFEGAQGVLLDQDKGFHPFTTWSDCTAAKAIGLINDLRPDADVLRIGIMRSHAMRHGPGPLPTETDDLRGLVAEHNESGEWQGPVRYGWFDGVLARYALEVAGGVDALMVTHMDLLSRLDAWQYCDAYDQFHEHDNSGVHLETPQGAVTGFRLPEDASLEHREQLTKALAKAAPRLTSVSPYEDTVIRQIEALLGRTVDITSCGPRAENVEVRHPHAVW